MSCEPGGSHVPCKAQGPSFWLWGFFHKVVFYFFLRDFSFPFQGEQLRKCQVLMPKGRVNKEE